MNLCDFLEQSTAAFEGVAGIASVLTCAFLAACVSVLLEAILSRSTWLENQSVMELAKAISSFTD